MRIVYSLLLFFSLGMLAGCQVEKEEESNALFTATINGEAWKFYEMDVERMSDGLHMKGMGYLNGDRGAEGLNLDLVLVNIGNNSQLEPPFEAYFMPGTQGKAAVATIKPTDSPETYDTELDANAEGRLVITKLENNMISGTFNFVAKNEGGGQLEVSNGSFSNIPVEE